MLHVNTKGILDCYAFVSVKFNGVLDFAGKVRILKALTLFQDVNQEGTFSRCKSRGGGDTVRYGSTFKLSGR
jgi:hypothetical protein